MKKKTVKRPEVFKKVRAVRTKTPTSFTLDNKTLGKLKKLAGTKKVSVSHLMSQAAEKLVAKM